MILFVNDSHFAMLIAAPVLRDHAGKVARVVVSTRIRGSLGQAIRVARKTSRNYMAYRMTVDLVTRVNSLFRRGSVVAIARQHQIPVSYSDDVNTDFKLQECLPQDLGVLVNFDQVIRRPLIERFEHGILNLHASRLPEGKGISPALWAFARGDRAIWASIYRVDSGIDSGPLFRQFQWPVPEGATAFSVYEGLCATGGERLSETVGDLYRGVLPEPRPQPATANVTTHSWPDATFDAALRQAGRHLISMRDIAKALRTS